MARNTITLNLDVMKRVSYLVEYGMNLSKVSDLLDESESTTIRAISHYERWLGFRIFERQYTPYREVEKITGLTNSGKVLLDFINAILAANDKFVRRMQNIHGAKCYTSDIVRMLAYRCCNCGAPLTYHQVKCDYCGTSFNVHPREKCHVYGIQRVLEDDKVVKRKRVPQSAEEEI